MKHWKLSQPNPVLSSQLRKDLKISHILTQVLINRGLNSAAVIKDFLSSDLGLLHDPFGLPDMHKAVSRIKKAISTKEKILIFGDYDVDGLTSLTILKRTLKQAGLLPLHYLPHRLKEGYGLNIQAAKFARENKVSLFIALDCGTTNFAEIEYLSRHKIDTLVVDHHYPLNHKLPVALAVVNPKRQDSDYPYFDLATAGITFKLVQALSDKIPEEELDLACLGTVADVAPLDGENRILVKNGLDRITQTQRPGLKALMAACGILGKDMSVGFINYILSPRINASGRMSTPEDSLRLLMSESEVESQGLAEDLNRYNRMRQQVESQILDEALTKIEQEVNFKDNFIIVLSKEGWHQGVLGIVASRISERFSRPAIIISIGEDVAKGSCRSVNNFHILEALSQCGKLLKSFGGHRYAAGLTIDKANIDSFRLHINEFCRNNFQPEDLTPVLGIDAEISFGDISLDLVNELNSLSPFGAGNPRPVFASYNLMVRDKPVTMGRDTLKFWVQGDKFTYPAVGFGMANFKDLITEDKKLDVAYRLSLDNWQGQSQIQLEIEDIKVRD